MTPIRTIFLEYPKLLCFAASCLLAYALHHAGAFDVLAEDLNQYGYASVFLGGLLFSFGFTTPFAFALFIDIAPQTPALQGAIIAGFGAFLADLGIFHFSRLSLNDELKKLHTTSLLRGMHALLHHKRVPEHVRSVILWSFAGLMIASPVPDEIGVTMISSIGHLRAREFAVLCFVLNTLGIFAILLLGGAPR